MKIYGIIDKFENWAGDPQAHRAEIYDFAGKYVSEINGYNIKEIRDFKLTEDLETILRERARLNDPIFGLNADTGVTETPVLNDAAKAKIKMLDWLFKAIAGELHGYKFCRPGVIDNWRKTYGVKLEFLAPARSTDKDVPLLYADLGTDTARKLYQEIKSVIRDCSEDDFIWYFGSDRDRETDRPQPIKWTGYKKDFAYFCLLVSAEINKSIGGIDWQLFTQIFVNDAGDKWDRQALSDYASKMQRGESPLPAKLKITSLAEANRLLSK